MMTLPACQPNRGIITRPMSNQNLSTSVEESMNRSAWNLCLMSPNQQFNLRLHLYHPMPTDPSEEHLNMR